MTISKVYVSWWWIYRRSRELFSGGVGILIKNSFLTEYNVKVIEKSFDGILGVEFRHKYTDFVFIVCACYPPPENSVWGKNSTAFFSHLISVMYTCNYADGMYLCGDYMLVLGEEVT